MGIALIPITLDAAAAAPGRQIKYSTSGGSATSGTDFTAISSKLTTISTGSTSKILAEDIIIDDAIVESTESFTLNAYLNRIKDSGFESGSVNSYWTSTVSGGAFEVGSESTYGGPTSNKVMEVDSLSQGYQSIDVVAGVTYDVTFKATRRSGATGGCLPATTDVLIDLLDTSGNAITGLSTQTFSYSNTTWGFTNESFSFTGPAGHSSLRLAFTTSNTLTCGAIIDDLSVWPQTADSIGTISITDNDSLPTVTSFTSTTADGGYKAGDTINITANISETITSGDTITVTLSTGETVVLTAAGSGTTLVGTYTVGAGITSSDLTITSFSIGSVTDSAGDSMTSTTMPTGSNNLGGSSALVIDTTSPSFTSSATASVPEAQTSAITLAASDTNAVAYSISGGDSALFSVNSSTGVVVFNTAPDFSSPADSDTNNTYVFTATSTDAAGNTDTQSVVVTVTENDVTAPTLSISASGASSITSGTSTSDKSITLTFTASEAITGFSSGDIAVTNGTISGFTCASSTVCTAVFTPLATGLVTIDVAAGSFTDSAGNNNTAAPQFRWTLAFSSPLENTAVISNIEASSNIAKRWVENSVNSSFKRLDWLRRHDGEYRLSHQGINLSFKNKLLNQLLNTESSNSKANITDKYYQAFNESDGDYKQLVDNLGNEFENLIKSEASKLIESPAKSLNMSGPEISDGWMVWSSGEVSVGNSDETSSISKQHSETQYVNVGFDKPNNNGSVYGFVMGYGLDEVEVGTTVDAVESKNYSLSAYGSMPTNNFALAEGIIGVGEVDLASKRYDGSDILIGYRKAKQAFLSAKIRTKEFSLNKLTLSSFGKFGASRTRFDAYTETGGLAALSYSTQESDAVSVSVGTDAEYRVPLNNGILIPFGKIEYGVTNESASIISMNYVGTPTLYDYTLSKDPREKWRFELGADLITSDGWQNRVSFEIGKNSHDSDLYRRMGISLDLRF